ncbi:hypothetical protein [Leisingera sp. ANG-M1]|uniref:hypothetical protein n=1 Tax=Leisingera sp. ANG-M1 TaxID=1577895 RepID=UPI001269AEB7|nr:hypothetical protein [Leisingera sp. ANG-M1]
MRFAALMRRQNSFFRSFTGCFPWGAKAVGCLAVSCRPARMCASGGKLFLSAAGCLVLVRSRVVVAITLIWLVFGLVWLIGFYYLARFRRRGLARGLVAFWLLLLVWLVLSLYHENHQHDLRKVVLSLYFNGHLVYGLCAFIGWNLGQKRRWRRKLKLFFRRLAGGSRSRSRLRS